MDYSSLYDLDLVSHIKARKQFLVSNRYKAMSFEEKIAWAKEKIKEFLEIFNDKSDQLPIISFSGGKDSCVLRHLVFEVQKELGYAKKCISITGAEIFHPATLKFIEQHKRRGDEIMPPLKDFASIIKDEGYPVISKQLAQKISHVRNTRNHKIYIRSVFGLDNKSFGTLPLIYCHFLDKKFIDYKISHKCCDYLKGALKHDSRPSFIGTTIEESRLRKDS
ncbi:MAG: hypothetical protein LBB45_07610 [Methanobrevibacter sp.]|nr:hypothetical protein [Candidatus Methanovirga basalitermitum]